MPRDSAIIFGDLIGKLDMLRVSCDKCGVQMARNVGQRYGPGAIGDYLVNK